jgi:hypothetical protein
MLRMGKMLIPFKQHVALCGAVAIQTEAQLF